MTDLKVVEIKRDEVAEYHQSEVIRLLKEALEYAEENACTSLSLIMIGNDGNPIDCYHHGGHVHTMVGAMEVLKHDFITEQIEPRGTYGD